MSLPISFLIALILSTTSGSISALASLTIIIMIRRSTLKLSTTYRRLFFGLSLSDLIQSLSQVLSVPLMPKGSMWMAIGNDISCDIIAFTANLGITCSVWYSLSISIYFLCVVKFEMEDTKIQTYIEPFLHGVPILYSLVINIYILSIDFLNPTGPICWVVPPKNEDGEIDEGEWRLAVILRWILGGPLFFVFVCNCIILAIIWWTVYYQSKQMNEYYARASVQLSSSALSPHPPEPGPQNQRNNRQGSGAEAGAEIQPGGNRASISSSLKSLFQRPRQAGEEAQGQGQNSSRVLFGILPYSRSNGHLSPLAARLSRPSRATIQRLKEISHRATAFIIGYMLTYIFSMIYRTLDSYAGSAPVAIIILGRFFLSFQGFFNMLIYTYPHCYTYHRHHNGTASWIRAFWEVIKSGGDSDHNQSRRRSIPIRRKERGEFSRSRRGSLRNDEPVLVDDGESFGVINIEPMNLNYHDRNDNQQNRMSGSNNEDSKNVEEGEQDVVLRNVPSADLDVSENYACDFEQRMQSSSDDKNELEKKL